MIINMATIISVRFAEGDGVMSEPINPREEFGDCWEFDFADALYDILEGPREDEEE